MKQTPNLSGHDRWTALILAGFLIAYFGAATVFQIRSEESFWAEGSPLDVMHGCMLWAASSMALMVAVLRLSKPGLAILWLLGSAAIGVVALDELFMLHEHSVKITGDDDHPKMALILCAAFGIWFLNRVETLRGIVLGLLIAGFLAHVAYLTMDMGDGDYFQVPLANHVHRILEEYFEMLASSLYFSAFFFHASSLVKETQGAAAKRPSSAYAEDERSAMAV